MSASRRPAAVLGIDTATAESAVAVARSTASQLLERHGIIDIDVAGLATDYCVRASALEAIEHGRHVRVFTDLVAGVHPESSQKALVEIAHAGADLVDSGA